MSQKADNIFFERVVAAHTQAQLLSICTRRSDTAAWGAGATLLSFVAALVHFTIEVLVYKTMSLKSAANPLVIAGAPSGLSAPHMQISCKPSLTLTSSVFKIVTCAMCADVCCLPTCKCRYILSLVEAFVQSQAPLCLESLPCPGLAGTW